MSTSDPAASYARRTSRQRNQLAARYDREARMAVAAREAQQTAEARARHIKRAVLHIERLGIVALTGRTEARAVTREELAVCKEAVKDAWKVLRGEADFVTVLR